MDFDEETVRQMQALSSTVYRLRPEHLNNDATFGEIAWVWGPAHARQGPTWRHRFWRDAAGEPIGWAWAFLPYEVVRTDGSVRRYAGADLSWLVHPDRPEIFDEILDWYEEHTVALERRVTVRAADTEALARLRAHGFAVNMEEVGDDGSWVQLNRRDLTKIEKPALPEGYRLRTAAQVGVEAAWRAHAGAWHPSSISLTGMRDLAEKTESYRPDLHMVVVSGDGTPVASATIWLDPDTGSAEFEPVGTLPEHRRKGVARAMLLHGMHAAKAAGAKCMLVACLGAAKRPAARELYSSIGFRPFTRDLPHLKRP